MLLVLLFELLKNMGAKEVIDRSNINDSSGKALLGKRWAGVVDTVGGKLKGRVVINLDL